MTEEQQVIYCVIASSKVSKKIKVTSYVQYIVSLHTDLYSAWQKLEQLYNSEQSILSDSPTSIGIYSNGFNMLYYASSIDTYEEKDFRIEVRPFE